MVVPSESRDTTSTMEANSKRDGDLLSSTPTNISRGGGSGVVMGATSPRHKPITNLSSPHHRNHIQHHQFHMSDPTLGFYSGGRMLGGNSNNNGGMPGSPLGTPSRKTALNLTSPNSTGTGGGPFNPRGRSQSLNYSTYSSPLLVPQSPPPFTSTTNRSLSLSPQAMTRAGNNGTSLPFLVNLNNDPHTPRGPSETRKAMEAAVQAERTRTKEMEQKEKTMTADELRAVLKRERNRMSRIAADYAKLKSSAVQCQAEAEIHEEGRINGLMRRLESLQIEKGRIIVELEREEEMLTNTLQKKLNEVRREKSQLEELITREQLSHTEMKTKLTGLRDTPSSTSGDSLMSATPPSAARDSLMSESSKVNPRASATPTMNALTEMDDEDEEDEEQEIYEDDQMRQEDD